MTEFRPFPQLAAATCENIEASRLIVHSIARQALNHRWSIYLRRLATVRTRPMGVDVSPLTDFSKIAEPGSRDVDEKPNAPGPGARQAQERTVRYRSRRNITMDTPFRGFPLRAKWPSFLISLFPTNQHLKFPGVSATFLSPKVLRMPTLETQVAAQTRSRY